MTLLPGRVTRCTLRRVRSGEIHHDTRIEFAPEADPWRSVRVTGRIPAEHHDDPEAFLLAALRSRYDVPAVENVRWLPLAYLTYAR